MSMPTSTRAAFVTAALLGALAGSPALAKSLPVSGKFMPEGKPSGHPSGMVKGSLDTSSDVLSYTITYDGLSGPVTAAHFHGPAKKTVTAGVLQPIEKPYDSPMTGTVTFSAEQVKQLEHGMIYANLHTAENPEGEARAQLHLAHKAKHG